MTSTTVIEESDQCNSRISFFTAGSPAVALKGRGSRGLNWMDRINELARTSADRESDAFRSGYRAREANCYRALVCPDSEQQLVDWLAGWDAADRERSLKRSGSLPAAELPEPSVEQAAVAPIDPAFRIVDGDGRVLGQFDSLGDALDAFNGEEAAAISIGSYVVTRRREGGAV